MGMCAPLNLKSGIRHGMRSTDDEERHAGRFRVELCGEKLQLSISKWELRHPQ